VEGVAVFNFAGDRLESGVDITSLLAETGIFPSKGEARKMVSGGGVSINKEKLSDANTNIDKSYMLHGKYILVQKGKKNYYLIKAV
jgi:tyrosyl-tRNA synthetase